MGVAMPLPPARRTPRRPGNPSRAPVGLLIVGFLLLVLFLVVPFVELFVIVQVADAIGLGITLLLMIAVSVAGAWLVKVEGLGAWRRASDQLNRGEVPSTELVNGLLILFAGALLLTPGFVTDTLGLLLLIPPSRAVVRALLLKRFQSRVQAAFAPGGATWAGSFGSGSARVYTGSSTYRSGGGPVIDTREVGGGDDPSGELGGRDRER